MINAKTEIYAILGDPISHSMSPVIMNSSFQRFRMNKVFLAFQANLDNFQQIMTATKLIGLQGYVFTMPIKEAALSFMDELSEEAEIIGAVNCACNKLGHLIGYNTDSIGFWNAVLEKTNSASKINQMFLMGAGGFARAAAAQAALQGVKKITVANILSEKKFVESFGRFIARLKNRTPDIEIQLIDWTPNQWGDYLGTCDLVVNATPNGMKGHGDLHLVFPYQAVNKEAIFFDAVYEPLKTEFLCSAEQQNFVTVDGISLLVHQGTKSFEYWTGMKVDPAQMREDILDFLSSN